MNFDFFCCYIIDEQVASFEFSNIISSDFPPNGIGRFLLNRDLEVGSFLEVLMKQDLLRACTCYHHCTEYTSVPLLPRPDTEGMVKVFGLPW